MVSGRKEAVVNERDDQQVDSSQEERVREPQASLGRHVDLNTSTEEELCTLPGIGPVLAARIVEYRTEVRPFEEPIEIAAVPGISERTYRSLADRLSVGAPEPAEEEVLESGQVPAEVEPGAEPMTDSEIRDPELEEAVELEIEEPQAEEQPLQEVEPAVSELDEWLEAEAKAEAPVTDEEPQPDSYVPEAPESRPRLRMPRWRRALAPPPEAEAPPESGEDTPEPSEPREPLSGQEVPPVMETPPPEPETVPVRVRQEVSEMAAPRWPEPPAGTVVPRQGASFWQLLVAAILSAIVGSLLALMILILVNRTLDFRGGTARAIQQEAARVDAELADLGADLEGLGEQLGVVERLARRLDDTEAGLQRLNGQLETIGAEVRRFGDESATTRETIRSLNGRVDGIENSMNGLLSQLGEMEETLGDLRAELGTVVEDVSALSEVVDGLREATQRFDAFLQGLRDLLQ